MKIKKEYLYAVALGLVVNATAVSAASVYDVNYDMDTGVVTIGGYATPKQKITLEILNDGIVSEDLKTARIEDIANYIYRVDQTTSAEDGRFDFSFEMPSSQDEYITRVNVGGVQEGLLVCVNPFDYQNALDAVNGASTATDMLTAINTQGNYLGLTNSYFSLLDSQQQLKIANDVLGCYEPIVMGKEEAEIGVSWTNIAKAIEFTFSGGKDIRTDYQYNIETPTDFETYEEF